MPMLETADGALWYEVTDLTPPWEEAPMVVFHHGVGIDHGIWWRWWPVLARRFRLVNFDMRGYGSSPEPGEGFAWSMEGLAEDTLAVARAAGAERFHFVGESIGGAIGYHLAIHHAQALISLIACTAPHRGGAIDWLDQWRPVIEGEGMRGWSERMMERRFAPGALAEAEWQWFHRIQSACDSAIVLGQAEMLAAVDMSDELGRITVPTLMIGGDASPFLPAPVLADTHSRVPGAEMQLFAGARHGVVLTHGTAAAQAMLDFLDRRAPAT
jgi:pimeloyl-ACP methyl ester carboxylesterase